MPAYRHRKLGRATRSPLPRRPTRRTRVDGRAPVVTLRLMRLRIPTPALGTVTRGGGALGPHTASDHHQRGRGRKPAPRRSGGPPGAVHRTGSDELRPLLPNHLVPPAVPARRRRPPPHEPSTLRNAVSAHGWSDRRL